MMQLDLAGTAVLTASWFVMYLMRVDQNVMVTLLVGGALSFEGLAHADSPFRMRVGIILSGRCM